MRALAFTLLGLALAACGDSPPRAATATATAAPAAAVVRVDMKHNRFTPRRITVRLGETVRWTNRDRVAHTVASQEVKLSSDAIRGGETFSYRPRRAGRFNYFCTIHAGQTGVLNVR
jgi:plastocyanin